jgi:hypothetical protein
MIAFIHKYNEGYERFTCNKSMVREQWDEVDSFREIHFGDRICEII